MHHRGIESARYVPMVLRRNYIEIKTMIRAIKLKNKCKLKVILINPSSVFSVVTVVS